MSSSLVKRILVAAVGIPTAFAVVWAGGWSFAVVLGALGALGALELFRLAERSGVRPLVWPGAIGAFLAPAAVLAVHPNGLGLTVNWLAAAGAIWILVVMAGVVWGRGPQGRPLLAASVTVFGGLYAGALLAFLVPIRNVGGGAAFDLGATWLVFLPLALTWVCDTCAMAGGSLVGGARLAPTLSPGKTWAGAVAGLLGATVASLAYGRWLLGGVGGVALGFWQLLAIGVAVGVLGQIGDLAESALKREAGVKDSGSFFPGHGGVLDRLDSLYWVIPSVALLLRAFGTL